AGLAEVHRQWGRLPWAEVVRPAEDLAAVGVPLPHAHEPILADCAPAMLLDVQGRAAFAPNGRLLQGGERVFHPGLRDAFAILAVEGPDAFYTGAVAESLVECVQAAGGGVTAEDLRRYEVRVRSARRVPFAG